MYNEIYVTPKVYSGENCVKENKYIFASFGKKCLIVTSKTAAVKSGALGDVESVLKELNIQYKIYDEIKENPLVSICIEGGKQARDFGADFIIGIGGGSALDGAKAVAICAQNPQFDIDGLYNRQIPAKALPLILIGTTSGTGSEITGVSVLTNDKNMQKKSISGADCYSAVSFCDAKYTYSVPYDTTVTTALDAFAHAIEGYFSPKANEISDHYAEKALPLLYKGLKDLKANGDISKETRDILYLGSVYAGYTLNICGAAFPHTVGYILTEEFGIPHGKACTAFFDTYLNKCKRNDAERYHRFLRLCGEHSGLVAETINALTNVKINATEEQITAFCERYKNAAIKNFNNTPGGFTYEEAVEAMKQNCVDKFFNI